MPAFAAIWAAIQATMAKTGITAVAKGIGTAAATAGKTIAQTVAPNITEALTKTAEPAMKGLGNLGGGQATGSSIGANMKTLGSQFIAPQNMADVKKNSSMIQEVASLGGSSGQTPPPPPSMTYEEPRRQKVQVGPAPAPMASKTLDDYLAEGLTRWQI